MKIGIDARLINETGVGRYIRNLIEELGKVDDKNTYVIFLNAVGFESFTVPNNRWKKVLVNVAWHTVSEQVWMPIVFSLQHLDLLHVPYFNIPIFYLGAMIVTIHDLTIKHFDTGKASTRFWFLYKIKRLLYGLVMSIGISRAKHIVVPSFATKAEIIEHYHVSEKKITVTYEGVDPQITNASHGKTNEQSLVPIPYFLCVGNAYPHKNLSLVIDALERSKTKAKVVFAGKEDFFYKRLRREITRRGLSSRVIFFGAADDLSLRSLYTHAQALLFPSLMEGFGLPPLEALSLGCPVIASDIPVHKEILKDLVTYFSPIDRDELTILLDTWQKADHQVKSDKVLLQLREYNWKKLALETLHVYQNI